MTAFETLVHDMRAAQKKYRKTFLNREYTQMHRLETQVDAYLSGVKERERAQAKAAQQQLF